MTHTEVHPLKCDICYLTFRRRGTLRYHKLTHYEEKKFSCDRCNFTFNRPDYLARHTKRIHKIEQSDNLENFIEEVPMVFVGSEVFTT